MHQISKGREGREGRRGGGGQGGQGKGRRVAERAVREGNEREVTYGIPSFGGEVTLLGAAALCALVVSSGDVVEDGGVGGVGLVEEGDDEAEGGLTVVLAVGVEEGDHGGQDWGRAGGTVDNI